MFAPSAERGWFSDSFCERPVETGISRCLPDHLIVDGAMKHESNNVPYIRDGGLKNRRLARIWLGASGWEEK